jgi:recombination protein RecA
MAEKTSVMTPEEYYKKIGKEDKDAIVNLSLRQPIDFIPTGSWPINCAIGDGTMTDKPGGFPRGHVVEVLGEESSGKSTLLLSSIRQAQELGGLCVLLDFEQTFHPGYAEKMGISLEKNKLIVIQPMHFQQGARLIKDSLNMRPMLIGIDSVSAMIPKEIFEGKVDEGGRIGLLAQLMSAFLQYITKFIKGSNTCLLFTNQMRTVINTGGWSPNRGIQEESSGGKALRYYSSVRLLLKKGAVEKVERMSKITGKLEKEPVNITTYVSVIKNKIDKPFKKVPVFIRFGEGFDNILSIVELAINIGVIKRAGAIYSFSHSGEQLLKVQGKEALWTSLNENPALFQKLQGSLVFKEDEQVKEEFKDQQDAPDEMDALLQDASASYVAKKKKKGTSVDESTD